MTETLRCPIARKDLSEIMECKFYGRPAHHTDLDSSKCLGKTDTKGVTFGRPMKSRTALIFSKVQEFLKQFIR